MGGAGGPASNLPTGINSDANRSSPISRVFDGNCPDQCQTQSPADAKNSLFFGGFVYKKSANFLPSTAQCNSLLEIWSMTADILRLPFCLHEKGIASPAPRGLARRIEVFPEIAADNKSLACSIGKSYGFASVFSTKFPYGRV